MVYAPHSSVEHYSGENLPYTLKCIALRKN